MERVLTSGPGGRILTHCNVWSPNGEWIVYDTRSDAAGSVFDSTRIEMVHTRTGEVRRVYESRNGACCGVATWHPQDMKVAFILGPEHPTADYCYGPSRRQGVIVDVVSGKLSNIDARDLTSNTPGALNGGSHLHIWHPHGDWIRFTYDDDIEPAGRNIAVAVPGNVAVPKSHSRNHDGEYVSTLWTSTDSRLTRACEECWVGESRAIAFQGTIDGVVEVFVVDERRSPRQLTYSQGLPNLRHWLQSVGQRIAFLLKDDKGVVQLWTVSLASDLRQLTRCKQGIGSAFTWQGSLIAAVVDGSVARIDVDTGVVVPLSPPSREADEIRPEACVLSPDGSQIAYVRRRNGSNHICIISAG